MRLLDCPDECGRLDLGASIAPSNDFNSGGADGEGECDESGEELPDVFIATLVVGVSWIVEGAAGLDAVAP